MAVRPCDVVTVAELAIQAPRGRTIKSMVLVEAAQIAASRGWVTVDHTGGECGIAITLAGRDALAEIYGPGWLEELAEHARCGWYGAGRAAR
jgi:hypothetical protein